MAKKRQLNTSRKRNKKRMRTSYLWTGVMVVGALAALAAAIWVVITVYERIAGDSDKWKSETTVEETSAVEIEAEEKFGWITDETGSRFREDDGSFAADTWKVWNEGLYYLKDDTYMAVQDFRQGGQVFSVDEKGKLTDIQLDTGWSGLTGDDNPDNLSSLVKSHIFWAYLSPESSDTGLFKPIYYRKTTETEAKILGDPSNPELSTKNSLQIHGDYLYYLPQITSGSLNSLSASEQDLCGKLFRMKPGTISREQLAENVTGYLVLEDDSIYCASMGEIRLVSQSEITADVPLSYQVKIQDGSCYLTDGTGKLVNGDASGIVTVDGRIYHLDNGRIKYVVPAEQTMDGVVYTLEAKDSSGEKAVFKKASDGTRQMVGESAYGIDSFCVAGNTLYYSAYEDREGSTRYSRLYRLETGDTEGSPIGKRFEGNILNLYYYKSENKIYGEYTPTSWKNCYGSIAVIGMDGSMKVIEDNGSGEHQDTDSNELLDLLMVDQGTVTCYLKTCSYDKDSKTWSVLSEKPYQFREQNTRVIFGGSSEAESSDPEETEETGSDSEETTGEKESETEETKKHQETEAESETTKKETVPETHRQTEAAETTKALEPGYEPASPPTTEAPGPGNSPTSSTIEASPVTENLQSGGPGGSGSDSVQFVGPGGN